MSRPPGRATLPHSRRRLVRDEALERHRVVYSCGREGKMMRCSKKMSDIDVFLK